MTTNTQGASLWHAGARSIASAVLYAVTATLSLNLAVPGGVISPLWLPAAVALVLCVKWRSAALPGIFGGAWLAFLLADWRASAALVLGAASALAAWSASALAGHFKRHGSDILYNGNLFRFVIAALLSGLISAPLAMAGAMIDGGLGPNPLLGWLTWTLGVSTGTVIFTPALRAWRPERRAGWHVSNVRPGVLEALAFVLLFAAALMMTFGGAFRDWPLAYLPLPFMIWAAYRFSVPVVAWSTAAVAVAACLGTLRGSGPFAHVDLNTALMLLVCYVSVIGIMGLALSSLIHQRGVAERKLKEELGSLERRVQERTQALREELLERQRVEQQLAEAQQVAQIGSWNWDFERKEIRWSPQLFRIYHLDERSAAPGPRDYIRLVHPDDRERVSETYENGRNHGTSFSLEHRICMPDGSTRMVLARGQAQRDAQGKVVRMFGTVQDITEMREAEAALREAQERYRLVVELSPEAVVIQHGQTVAFCNPAAMRLLRATRPEQVIGRPVFDLLPPQPSFDLRERAALLQAGQTPPPTETQLQLLDGSRVEIELSAAPFPHHAGLAILYMMRDITERKRSVEQLTYLAHYDSLTGLPNRVLFNQHLEHALSVAQRPGRTVEILFLDLDRFKQINDTFGHEAGDLVLKETAQRLRASLRESDTVARLAGDEFVVLVENVDEPQRGGMIAEKILLAFQPPMRVAGATLRIGTSIGIAAFPNDARDPVTLLKQADTAMYRAKQQGRNTYCYYAAHWNVQHAERRSLEQALRLAVERGEMSLHYQPRVDVASGRVNGMEALLRWQHPELGEVAPRRFLPLAEKNGLIMPIGYWGLRLACQQAREWQDQGAKLKVAVNFTRRQLGDPGLEDNIAAILADTGMQAEQLEIELTEATLMDDSEQTTAVLHRLRALGVGVTIDGFGSGPSSLRRLSELPIGTVKIGRSFVQGLPDDDAGAAITSSIIDLAHRLHCSVVAQGAETQQQYDFLRAQGCDGVQGFYFSAAMPAEYFSELVHAQYH